MVYISKIEGSSCTVTDSNTGNSMLYSRAALPTLFQPLVRIYHDFSISDIPLLGAYFYNGNTAYLKVQTLEDVKEAENFLKLVKKDKATRKLTGNNYSYIVSYASRDLVALIFMGDFKAKDKIPEFVNALGSGFFLSY